MAEEYTVTCVSPAGLVRSASVQQATNQQDSASVSVYGSSYPEGFTLTVKRDGTTVGTLEVDLADGLKSGGTDPNIGEFRGRDSGEISLGDVQRTPEAWAEPAPYDSGLDYFFSQGSAGPPVNVQTLISEALTAEGITLVVRDGPGIYRGKSDFNLGYESVDTLTLLQGSLLKGGAHWFLQGNQLIIDGASTLGNFSVPESDLKIISSHTFTNEAADEAEEISDEPAPNPKDYLTECPEYDPGPDYEPPPKNPENSDGNFPNNFPPNEDSETELDIDETIQNGRPTRTEVTETGPYNTPAGPQYGVRTKTITNYLYDGNCPDTVVQTIETVYNCPDMGEIDVGAEQAEIEEAALVYQALVAKSAGGFYIQSQRVETNYWAADGHLARKLNTTREINVFAVKNVGTATLPAYEIFLTYDERVQGTLYVPLNGGRWHVINYDRQIENPVVYELEQAQAQEGQPGRATATVARVQKNPRPVVRSEVTNSAPPQAQCPEPPAPEEDDESPNTYYPIPPEDDPIEPDLPDTPCIEEVSDRYREAYREWADAREAEARLRAAQLANMQYQDRSVHQIQFTVPRLSLKVGETYGGGYIVAVSHSYGFSEDDEGGTVQVGTSATVWALPV